MIKKLFLGFIFLVIIGLVALFIGLNSIVGGGVKAAFNKLGPEITGTNTYIDSASVNVFGGNLGINGLNVGNPDGFSDPSAMTCSEIYVDLNPKTIFSDRIEVNEIRIVAPEFTVEQSLSGNNLQVINNNIKKFRDKMPSKGDKPSDDTSADDGSEKTLVLHKLIVSDGQVDLAVLTIKKELPLPTIDKDFGGEGVEPAEAIEYVMSVVLEKVIETVAEMASEIRHDPQALLKGLTGGEDTKEAGEAINQAGEAIKGLFE
ncbi:MAG: hypothetical protein AAFX93_12640 [Verrucomicrobiota bacterium]